MTASIAANSTRRIGSLPVKASEVGPRSPVASGEVASPVGTAAAGPSTEAMLEYGPCPTAFTAATR